MHTSECLSCLNPPSCQKDNKKNCPGKEFALLIHLLVNDGHRLEPSRSKLFLSEPVSGTKQPVDRCRSLSKEEALPTFPAVGQVPPQVEQQPSLNKISLIKLVCSTLPLISRPPTSRMNGRGRSIRWPCMPTRCPCCKQQRPVCVFFSFFLPIASRAR